MKNKDQILNEPIAIIGMGCRFPGGVKNIEDFWNLMTNGVDGITEIPAENWSNEAFYDHDAGRPGKIATKYGGYIEDRDYFDPGFFGISPREASRMDPQQRMLLETSWEAMENAGIIPETLTGSKTAVYVGISGHDYGILQSNPLNRELVSSHTMTGITACIAANRISYLLDLRGPSMAVDTACSASLIALHLACQSIKNGESDLAFVAGVNSLVNPETTLGFSQGTFLSKDGRCKTFDASANGYIRSEGAGVVILKPLSKALEDGDRIYSVYRGSATNQDGRTSGMTVPRQEAQEEMILEACRNSGVQPSDITYVEAHGTGTAVGDPIEAAAIGKGFGVGRTKDDKVLVGSVKTNIGHLESAAGIAGLIKASLILNKKMVPPNLHFNTPNPDIDFEGLNLEVVTELKDLPKKNNTSFAAINSFGFGGANAHAILETPHNYAVETTGKKSEEDVRNSYIFPLSAKTESALKKYVERIANYLNKENEQSSLESICASAAIRKGHYEYRLAVSADSIQDLREKLEGFLKGETNPAVLMKNIEPAVIKGKTVFVLSGQGPQWWGMAREYMNTEPVFREVIERCHAELSKLADWSLVEEILHSEEDSNIGETNIAQPAIFSIQIALAALWKSWGIEANAFVGHSIGEVAAAYLSGALNFEDAIKVIFHRSRIQQKASGKGKMLAVGLTAEEAKIRIDRFKDRVSIAAVNGAETVALAGDPEPLEEIAAELEEEKIFNCMLRIKVAFHSHHMDPLEDELRKSLKGIKSSETKIPMYSTVTKKVVGNGELNAEYWWRNIREPVYFSPTVNNMIGDDFNIYIELGAHPIHSTSIDELLAAVGKKGLTLGSLKRKESDRRTTLNALGNLYVHGRAIDWKKFYTGLYEPKDLPYYPWEREKYWTESNESANTRLTTPGHPLVGRFIESPDEMGRRVYEVNLDPQKMPWLSDHRVQGPIVFPGAGYMDMTLGVIEKIYGEGVFTIEDVAFQKALFIPEEGEGPTVQFVLSPENEFTIYSRNTKGSNWTKHVTGKVAHRAYEEAEGNPIPELNYKTHQDDCEGSVDTETLYNKFDFNKLQLGPTFRAIEHLWKSDTGSFAKIDTPDGLVDEFYKHCIHPGILDSCFQGVSVVMGTNLLTKAKTLYLPVKIKKLTYVKRAEQKLNVYGQSYPQLNPGFVEGDIWITDTDNRSVAHLEGFICKAVDHAAEADPFMGMYDFQWKLKPRALEAGQEVNYLPTSATIIEDTADIIEELKAEKSTRKYYEEIEPQMNAIAVHFLMLALEKPGYKFNPGATFKELELFGNLGFQEKHRQYFHRILMILTEHGVLKNNEGTYQVLNALPDGNPEQEMDALIEAHPLYATEMGLIQRCGPGQGGILQGEINPLDLIFPKDDFKAVETLYSDSFSFVRVNKMIKDLVGSLVKDLPEDRTLRILEIGAGTGGTSAGILPNVPADRTEYVYTDVGQVFLNNAKERFSGYSFIEYKYLDIEKDPIEQGYGAHSFDLIVASNVLHATTSLDNTFSNIKKLLSSRGALLFVEVTKESLWVDLSFGTTDGWWCFQDKDLRSEYPLLSQEGWLKFMENQGFSDGITLSDAHNLDESGNSILIAFGPTLSEDELTPSLPAEKEGGAWIIFTDKAGLGDELEIQLETRNAKSFTVTPGLEFGQIDDHHYVINPSQKEDYIRVFTEFRALNIECRGILHLWNVDYFGEQPTTALLDDSQLKGCYSVVELLQAYMPSPWQGSQPPIWVITRGSMDVGLEEPLSIAQTSIRGIVRVILSEHVDLKVKILDLSPDCNFSQDAGQILAEFDFSDDEEEIVYRGRKRFVHRLNKLSETEFEKSVMKQVTPENAVFKLEFSKPGSIDNLQYIERERTKPTFGEVEIKVEASALNFRDVMLTLDLLPDDAVLGGFYGRDIGVEYAGTVVALGEGVSHLKKGDKVMGFASGSFASHVSTRADYALPIPVGLNYEEAAALPMAYITAYYSLISVARIQKGERVLIHAGAGGVGQAAIRIALDAGAEVYATAGKPEKREYLKSLGVKGVYDSRSLGFADAIKEATDGEGVDIVLNSLQGRFITKSIEVLKPLGRFIEIGKKDIYDNFKMGLKPFGNNLNYSAVDIDKLLLEQPDICANLFHEIMEKFAMGLYTKLPVEIFPAQNIQGAFRHMAGAKHTGKIVLSFSNDQELEISPPTNEKVSFRPDGTYLVTGGLGGFGLKTAHWLVENGARHIVLVSRSGVALEEELAESLTRDMKAKGAKVYNERADITLEADVVNLFTRLSKLPPLRGIYHAAMVLHDGVLMEMDQEQFLHAMLPKWKGAWYMHTYSLNAPLDHFVMYSSMTAIIGTPGQGNYAAGNNFLDYFTRYRRQSGLPALTINWGVLGDVGFVARNSDVQSLARQGWKEISPDTALEMLAKCSNYKPVQAMLYGIDWAQIAKLVPTFQNSPRFMHLVRQARLMASGSADIAAGGLRATLSSKSAEDSYKLLKTELTLQIARIFDASPERIDHNAQLTNIGMDSLMAGQIRNWIASELKIDFPTMGLMSGPTINELTDNLLSQITQSGVRSESDMEVQPLSNMGTPWLQCARPNSEKASMRIFGFPFVGGGASIFNSWNQHIDESIEMIGVQYPGRESRIAETPLDNMEELVKSIVENMLPFLDRSYVLYGHSMGALISYEVARYLQKHYQEKPLKLVIGAWTSPSMVRKFALGLDGVTEDLNMDELGDREVFDNLTKNRIIYPEDLGDINDPGIIKALMPSVRADLKILGGYKFDDSERLDCPITVLKGDQDPLFQEEDMRLWKDLTSQEFNLVEVSGKHLFIKDNPEDVVKRIRDEIEQKAFPSFANLS